MLRRNASAASPPPPPTEYGFRAVAPDMRGYGNSSIPAGLADYALEEIVLDMLELLAHLGRDAAVWVGHDWGAPVVWALASHHAAASLGVAGLCVPHLPRGFTPSTLIEHVDRRLYPADQYPAGQWDYQLYYEEHFDEARRALEADPSRTLRALMRAGQPDGGDQPYRTARFRRAGGWFGGAPVAPDLPRDPAVLGEDDLAACADALSRNGFAGPDAWYMNAERNRAYAARAPEGGRLRMPVLFLHAAYDWLCTTRTTTLAEPMRASCDDLEEVTLACGHWMPQEKPAEVNAAIAGWLARRLPAAWPGAALDGRAAGRRPSP